MAAKLHKQAFGDPRDMITARLPDEVSLFLCFVALV